jgi:hypothetical protein
MITLACVAAINESVETLDVECGGAAAQAVGSLHLTAVQVASVFPTPLGRYFRFDLCTAPVPWPNVAVILRKPSVLPWARAR